MAVKFYGIKPGTSSDSRKIHVYNVDTNLWSTTEIDAVPESNSNYEAARIKVINPDDIWIGMKVVTSSAWPKWWHWDGNSWTSYTQTDGGSLDTRWEVIDMSVVSSDSVWFLVLQNSFNTRDLFRWNGTSVIHVNAFGSGNIPAALTAVSDTHVISVGRKTGYPPTWPGVWLWNGTGRFGEAQIIEVHGKYGVGHDDEGGVYILRNPCDTNPSGGNLHRLHKGDFGSWSIFRDESGRQYVQGCGSAHNGNNSLIVRNKEIIVWSLRTSDNDKVIDYYDGDAWHSYNTTISTPWARFHAVAGRKVFCYSTTGGGVNHGYICDLDTGVFTQTSDHTNNPLIDVDGFQEDPDPPVITPLSPQDGEEDVAKDASIRFTAEDAESGVDFSTVKAWVRGILVFNAGSFADGWSGTYNAIQDGYEVIMWPIRRWAYYDHLELVKVRAYAEDGFSNQANETWSFMAGRELGMQIYPMLFEGVRKVDESYD